MKKLSLLLITLFFLTSLQAQWVNNPSTNTFLANCSSAASEVYLSTDQASGDTYVQWHYQGDNGWSPWIQRLNAEGVPQWSADGIHITTPDFATWSPGYAMTAVEGGVVSVFRTLGPHHWAVKINADGTFPWGEHGFILFNGEGGGRSEVLAGDDGGVWALGTDMDSTYLQYINPDGSMRPYVTINDPVKKCSNGILIPTDNGVFVVYSKHTLQGYSNYNKEIYLAGYNKDGEMIVPETLLLGLQTVGASYIHYAISDGLGGGYVYQWHKAIDGAYNIYVTHFDANGTPTITNPNGIPVHTSDPSHYYTNAYATIDPQSHDLILAYRQTDSGSQSQDMVLMNRITASGEKIWDNGLAVTEAIGDYSDILADAFEYGDGFAVIYRNGQNIVKAVGYDMDGNVLWNTTMCSNRYDKSITENSTGFHHGQNIIAWVNSSNGGLYGQNIGWDGTMGEITPPTPPVSCDPPTNFQGEHEYVYPPGYNTVWLTWTAPETLPLHYNLYCDSFYKEIIEVDAGSTSYYMEEMPGDCIFRLTAVYEDCESDYALTPEGDNYLEFYILLASPEIENEEIVTLTKVYSMSGQLISNANLEELSRGVYILQGLTSNGKLVTKKIVVK